MTENKEQKPEEKNIFQDINRYFPAIAAAKLQETDPRLVGYALNDLADSMGNISKTERELLLGSITNEEGLNLVMGIYPKKYNEELGKADISEFLKFYDPILSKYAGKENANKIKNSLMGNGNLKIGDLEKKMGELNYKLEGHKKGYAKIEKEDELKKLEESLKNYQKLMVGISLMQDNSIEELRSKYYPRYEKDTYEKYASQL